MSQKSSEVGYLYVNGLGNGNITPKDRVVDWWWRRSGRVIEHAKVDWYDGGSLQSKEKQIEEATDRLLKTFGGVAIIGGSAGGSLALNVFSAMKDKNVCVIAAHARVAEGDYRRSDRMSLYHRAKMDTNHPSQAFFDSVVKAETSTIPRLTEDDKERVFSLTQLTDMVVDLSLMQIDGVQTHRSVTFGHSGGFLAHLVANRDIIADFAESKLLAKI